MQTQNILQQAVQELGIDHMPEEERDAFLAEVGAVLFRGVMRRVWNSLDRAKQDTLTSLLDASGDDPDNEEKGRALEDFMKKNVPDYAHFVEQEVAELRATQEDIFGELMS